MKQILLFLAVLFSVFSPVYAQVVAMDEVRLTDELIAASPCCVIDARAPASQKKDALPDALPYHPDLVITPTASVVVVADSDADANASAEALADKYPGKRIIAVMGGLTAWQSASKAARAAFFVPGGTSQSFVIPSNTCEQGAPLQTLQRDKAK